MRNATQDQQLSAALDFALDWSGGYVTFFETSAAKATAVSRTHKHASERASDSLQCGTLHRRPYSTTLAVERRFKNPPHVCICALPPKIKEGRLMLAGCKRAKADFTLRQHLGRRRCSSRAFNPVCRIVCYVHWAHLIKSLSMHCGYFEWWKIGSNGRKN